MRAQGPCGYRALDGKPPQPGTRGAKKPLGLGCVIGYDWGLGDVLARICVVGRRPAVLHPLRKAEAVDCPKCKAPMMIVEFEGVELDHCPECEGTWFDADELERLFEGLGAEAAGMIPRDMESLPEADTGEEKRRCPACGRKMRKVLIGGAGNVLIDVCSRGDGLWFDNTEVAQFAEQVTKALPAAAGKAIRFMGRVFRGQRTSGDEEDKEQ